MVFWDASEVLLAGGSERGPVARIGLLETDAGAHRPNRTRPGAWRRPRASRRASGVSNTRDHARPGEVWSMRGSSPLRVVVIGLVGALALGAGTASQRRPGPRPASPGTTSPGRLRVGDHLRHRLAQLGRADPGAGALLGYEHRAGREGCQPGCQLPAELRLASGGEQQARADRQLGLSLSAAGYLLAAVPVAFQVKVAVADWPCAAELLLRVTTNL